MRRRKTHESEKSQTEYCHWHREHDLWERDVSRWQADHQHALVELEHLAQQFVNHGAALRRFANDLEAHREALRAIEASEQGGLAPEATVTGLAGSHAGYMQTHERIRQHHNIVMALLSALSAALRAPM